ERSQRLPFCAHARERLDADRQRHLDDQSRRRLPEAGPLQGGGHGPALRLHGEREHDQRGRSGLAQPHGQQVHAAAQRRRRRGDPRPEQRCAQGAQRGEEPADRRAREAERRGHDDRVGRCRRRRSDVAGAECAGRQAGEGQSLDRRRRPPLVPAAHRRPAQRSGAGEHRPHHRPLAVQREAGHPATAAMKPTIRRAARGGPGDGAAPRAAPDGPSGGGRTRTVSTRASPAWLLGLIGAGVFFGTLDQTVVVTVLADILKDLHLPINRDLGKAPWIVTGYLLGYTIAMPIVGRLADVIGRVRVFAACLLIFCAGSVLTAIAPNFWFLVGARAFQAIGGGGLLPVGLAIAADVTRERRALALGALAAANNGSTFIGPGWGAAIAGLWSWRALFWLNLPLVLPMLIAAPLLARD